MLTTEERIAALEIAVQELLKNDRNLRYIDGVLCERRPYAKEWTPVRRDAYQKEVIQ
jgi:hypothetical protein